MASISTTEIRASCVKTYKVVAGDMTVAQYNTAQADDLDGSRSLQHRDWVALYTQFQRDHVVGTIPYRWEKGHSEAVLIEVSFSCPLTIAVFDGAVFHDGSMSGDDKAAAVKMHLGIDPQEALLEHLGRAGKMALVRETDEEWELIVPHELLGRLPFTERVLCRFQRHPQMTTTHRWQDATGSDSAWRPWREGITTLPAHVLDLPMEWLPSHLTPRRAASLGQETKAGDWGLSVSMAATSASTIRLSWRCFRPRTIAISGVSSGLGRALLRTYAAQGHRVFGIARREQQVQALRASHPSADIRVLDVTDDDGVRDWARACAAAGVDLVICNAGISPESSTATNLPPWEVPVASFDATVDINVKGVANMIRHFTPHLIEAGRGMICAISSGLGRSASPTYGAYCASKWAVEGLMKCVACALPPPLAAVPMAPGEVCTGMHGGPSAASVDAWVAVAAPQILGLRRQHNGVSMSVPGFYSSEYMASWTVPDMAGSCAPACLPGHHER